MHNFFKVERLQFRILYRHFLLRVIDLDALSAQGDATELLGKLAGILIMFSLIWGGQAFFMKDGRMTAPMRFSLALGMEHFLISGTMLVVGLFTVLSWDSTFPDQRDAMVLLPLPVRTRTLFLSKLAASCVALSLAVLLLNALSGLTWPLVLAPHGILSFPRTFTAYWATMFAAGAFLYCSVLAIQGIMAQVLPRRYFLRLSAVLQVCTFCLFLGIYFLQPSVTTPQALVAPENRHALAWLPTYWFLGLFNWLNGTMQPELIPLVRKAAIGLGLAILAAASSLVLCYLHTIRRVIEEPDIISRGRGTRWSPGLGKSLDTALLQFSLRSLFRSRQHRIVLAFYLGVGFAVALSCLRIPAAQADLTYPPWHVMSVRYLIPTFVMMSFAVVGMRLAFALPVSLSANWIFRITELRPAQEYFTNNRKMLILLAVMPICVGSAIIALPIYPWGQVGAHCGVLALLGLIFIDLSLIRFQKIPYTCSWLPGKANVQFAFWAYLLLLVPLTDQAANWEQSALESPIRIALMLGVMAGSALCLHLVSIWREKSEVLQFEDAPAPVVQSLGLERD
jgi:hypothetical protein